LISSNIFNLKPTLSARFLWLTLLFLVAALKGQSGTIAANRGLNDHIQASVIQFFIDDSGKETFNTIQHKKFNADPETAFKKIASYNRKRNVWAKINITNNSTITDSVTIRFPFTTDVKVYVKQNGSRSEFSKGYIHPEPFHQTNLERFYSDFQLPPNSKTEIWICVNNYTRYLVSENEPMGILSPQSAKNELAFVIEKENFVSYFYFAFIAFLLFQMFYVALQWFLARRREYGYYLSFISITFLYFSLRFFTQSNYAFSYEYLIVAAAYLNDIFLLLPPYFYFLFGRHFLDLKKVNPKLNNLIWKMGNLMLVVIILVPVINYMVPNDLPKTAITMSAVSLQFILSLIALYNIYFLKTTLSRFLLVGSLFAFLGHIIALSAPVIFPESSVVRLSPIHFTMVGILIEIGVFNSGLLFKARLVELARVETQQNLINELRKRQQLQAEYSTVREKISADLHDDLGSNLSSIGVFSYAAKKKLALNEHQETEKLIQQIEQRAHESLQSLSDLVWSVNPINDNNEKLIARINNFIKSITQAKGIQFENYIDSNFYLRPINQLEKRNIQLLVKEAVNNIVKHAKAQTIILSIEEQNNSFCIKIVDNGVGFNTDTPNEGNGLQGMKKRIQEINGSFKIVSESGRTEICFTLDEKAIDKKH
jgi:signal transduction histidine kinase